MKLLPSLIQGTKEWLEYRRFRIAASEISAIMGVSPYMTRLELWTKKLLGETNASSSAMRRGTALEPLVRNTHNEEYETNYQPMCVEHSEIPYLFCSLDGWDETQQHKIIEIKCLKKEHHELARAGHILNHYMPQLQHQMLVTGESTVKYLSYHQGEIIQLIFSEDREYQKRMLEECETFYQEIMQCKPPLETERDIDIIHESEATGHIKAYEYAKRQKEIWEEAESRAKENILKFCNPQKNRIQIDDWMVSKILKKGRVDYEQIDLLKSMDLEAYRKPANTMYRLTKLGA